MAGPSPTRGLSAVEPAFGHFSPGENRKIRQKRSSGYTFNPQFATHKASAPPTPQQLAWRSIQNTAAAKSQPLPDVSRISDLSGPSGAIAGVPTQNPIHQYGAVTILQEPNIAGFHHSSPAPATAAAAETGTASVGNLLDTVSDSVSLGLASQMSHQPEPALAPHVEGN